MLELGRPDGPVIRLGRNVGRPEVGGDGALQPFGDLQVIHVPGRAEVAALPIALAYRGPWSTSAWSATASSLPLRAQPGHSTALANTFFLPTSR